MKKQVKPNILFILSDQHSHCFLGCNNTKLVQTPNLDRLSQEGVYFSNAYCQNPLCVPSRSSLITGLYSKEIGIYENRHILESDSMTIPKVLGNAGYRTCLIGKAHFNGEQFQGYQQRPYGDFYGQGHQPEYIRTDNNGEDESGLGDILGNSGATAIPLPMTQTEICVSEAVKWLQCHVDTQPDTPFFLSVNFDKPHFPMRAPQHLFEKYRGRVSLPEYPSNYLEDIAVPFVRKAVEVNGRSRAHFGNLEIYEKALAAYCACVEWVDDALGRILHALEYLGLKENTLVIYSSDHGEMAGEKGAWQKTLFFDQSAKVPLIMRWPGHYISNIEIKQITGLIDIFPTLCRAAGIDIPKTCSGIDLTPALQAGEQIERDAIYCESSVLKHPEHSGCMIRTQQYKFSLYLDGVKELYDMENDPGEWNNLSGNPRYQEIESYLESRVCNFWGPEHQTDRYKTCPMMKREKHFYLYSNQFASSNGVIINARP